MKVITWNCNMAFRKKAGLILKHRPDILVIPECEHPDRLKFPAGIPKPANMLWYGNNPNKGLGIFSYGNYQLRQLDCYDPTIRTIVPIAVTGGDINFTLFAAWAYNPTDPDGQYVEQVWKALHHYHDLLTGPTMLMGDLNSNTIWDRKYRVSNHSSVVKLLDEKGIQSAYHLYHKQQQGKEKHPTFYLYRHKDKPYHLDYCFVSATMADKIQQVTVGRHHAWKPFSDHVPVIVRFSTFE